MWYLACQNCKHLHLKKTQNNGTVWKSKDIPCIMLDSTGDGIEGCVGIWTLNFEIVMQKTLPGSCKRCCKNLELVEKKTGLSRLKATFESVEGNIWSSTAPESHFVWIWAGLDFHINFEVFSDLKIKLKIFSKSNWKEWIMGLTTQFLTWWKLNSDSVCCFVLLYPLMLFISMQRSRWRCWYLWGWRPKEQKRQIRLRPWEFFQETFLYVLDARCPSLHLL